jgi:hypothetical protein
MHNGKQVTKKPQKKVGVPRKKRRSEENKGGEPAVPCRERLQPGAAGPAPPDQRKVRKVAYQTRLRTPMGMKAEGQGGSKTTGWAGHSPLRAAHRVGAEREDPAAASPAGGDNDSEREGNKVTRTTLLCKARLANSCAHLFGKLGKHDLAVKAP